MDLELDPVRHERDGTVEVQDLDELASAVDKGWITAEDAALARTTAEELRLALAAGREEWDQRGWTILAGLL